MILLGLWGNCLLAQNKLINDGSIVKVAAGTTFRVSDAGIDNKNSGTIDNQGNIYVGLHFNQTTAATYNGGVTSWLWFEGVANQNIQGDAPLNIPKLRIDNGNRLILGNHVNVSNQVDLMNNGAVELGNFNLVVAPSGTVTGYDANNYIVTNGTGYLQQQIAAANVVFPIGNNTYNPATINNAGTVDNFQAKVEDAVYDAGTTGPLITDKIVNATWHIQEAVAGGSMANITVQWVTAQELPSFNRNSCAVSHWDGTTWDHSMAYTAATNVGLNTWTQTRNGQTSFSPFAVEDLEQNLPVELLYFNAVRKNIDWVLLDWSTATEINNNGFELQRMLDNETDFQTRTFVNGHGTTSVPQQYDYLDANSHAGTSYYRLKQLDFDGTITYSEIRAVSGIRQNGNIVLFPNPTTGTVQIRFDAAHDGEEATIMLYASDGKQLWTNQVVVESSQTLMLFNMEQLAAGMYLVRVQMASGASYTYKVEKTTF